VSKYSLLIWSTSKLDRSSSGTPNARDAKTASCWADNRLPDSTCSTKGTPDDWDCT